MIIEVVTSTSVAYHLPHIITMAITFATVLSTEAITSTCVTYHLPHYYSGNNIYQRHNISLYNTVAQHLPLMCSTYTTVTIKITDTPALICSPLLYGIRKTNKYWGVHNKLSISIATMVLKRLKFSCPTNRKIDACMRKGKKFQNSGKIK